MANIRLNIGIPIPTSRQRPVDYVRIDIRASETLPWTEQDRVAPNADGTPVQMVFENVPPGDHFFRGVVVDVDGKQSGPKEAHVSAPFDNPSELTDFTATLE